MDNEKIKPFILLTSIFGKYKKNEKDANVFFSFEDIIRETSPSCLSERKNNQIYVNSVYEESLFLVADKLNFLHHKNFSKKYWEILLGPWLKEYISVCYQRYNTLLKLKNKYQCFQTVGLHKNSFVFPVDTSHFLKKTKDDDYNLQLYTRIIEFNLFAEIVEYIDFGQNEKILFFNRSRREYRIFMKIIFFLFKKRKKIIISGSYFPRLVRIYFLLCSRGKVLDIPSSFFCDKKNQVDGYNSEMRFKLSLNVENKKGFEKTLFHFIFEDLPICFVENYHFYYSEAEEMLKMIGNLQGIASANSWHENELFKHIAALGFNQNAMLYALQHGGNSGAGMFLTGLEHELSIANKYYSWGWNSQRHVQSMPANKLVGIKPMNFDNNSQNILYVQTSAPRFSGAISVLPPAYFEQYLDDQKYFIDTLGSTLRKKLLIRLHHEDNGWGVEAKLRKAFPEIQFDPWRKPFYKSLASARLYVSDHFSTTYVEALAHNKPSILFWKPEYFPLCEDAKPYFQALREVGILFDDPGEAGFAVCSLIDDVKTWWFDSVRQEAIKFFCNRYGKTSKGARKIWLTELIQNL